MSAGRNRGPVTAEDDTSVYAAGGTADPADSVEAPIDQLDGSGEESADFPAGVFAAIDRAFGWLCTGPAPLALDGREIPGLPAGPIPLERLRDRLLDPATPGEVRARVWADLVRRAHSDGPSWVVAAAGMALPMFAAVAAELTRDYAGDPEDICAEIVAGFVAALPTADPQRAPLVVLRWGAWRSGHAALLAAMDAPRPLANGPGEHGDGPWDGDDDGGAERRDERHESSPPPGRAGHPDIVLARAVRDGVLTDAEAALIGTTRLERLTIEEAAELLGERPATVWSRRYRAESRLIAHLTATGTEPGRDPEPGSGPGSGPGTEPGRGTGRGTGSSGRARREGGRMPARSAVRVRSALSATHRRRHRSRRARPQAPGTGTGTGIGIGDEVAR